MASTTAADPKAGVPEPAKLSRRAVSRLTTMVSDVRGAVSRLEGSFSPLDVLTRADAVPAMRELYYELQREDPSDAMPARKLLGDWLFAQGCVIPTLTALHSDPAAASEARRWTATVYQTLRLVSMLCVPIEESNSMLRPGCNLEVHLMDLKHCFATSETAFAPLVTLLQHYLQKKAENAAALAVAEDSKVEDARIENILRFFRNLLTPPRKSVDRDLARRDRGIHVALVGAAVRADLFATISILFSNASEARNLHTSVVLLCCEIYSLAFRHSTSKELAVSATRALRVGRSVASESVPPHSSNPEVRNSVFQSLGAESSDNGIAAHSGTTQGKNEVQALGIRSSPHGVPRKRGASSGLRAALLRERSLVGGNRSVVASTRWTTRHSGSFQQVVQRRDQSGPRAAAQGSYGALNRGRGLDAEATRSAAQIGDRSLGPSSRITKSLSSKRILSAKSVSSAPKKGLLGSMQHGMQTNSELLCLFSSRGLQPRIAAVSKRTTVGRTMRSDLVKKGLSAAAELVQELVRDSFAVLIRELHDRIIDAKNHASQADLWVGRRYYLTLVGIVTGFQREFAFSSTPVASSTAKASAGRSPLFCQMQDGLTVHRENVVVDWKAVQDAISLDSFRLVFDSIVDARGEGKRFARELELATRAMMEMMKILHWMSVAPPSVKAAAVVESAVATKCGAEHSSSLAPSCEGKDVTEPPSLVISMGAKDRTGIEECDQGSPAGKTLEASRHLSRDEHSELGDELLKNQNGDGSPRLVLGGKNHAAEDDVSGEHVDDGAVGSARVASPVRHHIPLSAQLTPRETALNLLEDLFERESYLETPSMLAKEFDPKLHGFSHLANVVEIAFTFTTTLMGRDFDQITVARKKRKRRSKKALKPGKDDRGGDNGAGASADGEDKGVESANDASGGDLTEQVGVDVFPSPNAQVLASDVTVSQPIGCGDPGSDHQVDSHNVGVPEKENVSPRDTTKVLVDVEDRTNPTTVEGNMSGEPVDEESSKTDQPQVSTFPNKEDKVADPPKSSGEKDALVGKEVEEGVELLRKGEDSSGDDEDDDEDYIEAEHKIAGEDVIRRFASPRALQHISLGLRAALSSIAGICGTLLPIPEGATDLLSVSIAAKSLAVLQSVWNIVGLRERGAFRIAFYNLATLQLLATGLAVSEERQAPPSSILYAFGDLAKTVSREFYAALQMNPVLLVDALFLPDIGTQRMYASKMYQLSMMRQEEEARRRGDLRGSDEDSSDSERPITKRRRKVLRHPRHSLVLSDSEAPRAPRPRRSTDEADEIVDDIDNLDLAQNRALCSSDSAEDGAPRMRSSRKQGGSTCVRGAGRKVRDFVVSDGESSSDSSGESEASHSPKRKRAVKGKGSVGNIKKGQLKNKINVAAAVNFSSEDEYDSADLDALGISSQAPVPPAEGS